MAEVRNIMRIDHILSTGMNAQLVTSSTFSCITKDNIDKLYDWCMQFLMPVAEKGEHVNIGSFHLDAASNCKKVAPSQRVQEIWDSLGSLGIGERDSPCNERKTLIFPKHFTFKDAALLCKQLNGNMPLPRDNEDINPLLAPINYGDENVNCPSVWLPIVEKGEGNSSAYQHFNFHQSNLKQAEKVDYLPWQFGQPNGLGWGCKNNISLRYIKR